MPETFVISKDGRIAYKQIGPLSVEILEKKIIPLIQKLKDSRRRRSERRRVTQLASNLV